MINEFVNAMRAAGLGPVETPDFLDGSIVRYRVKGDKSGSRNGWAVFNRDPVPFGVFGSWKTGEQHSWRSSEIESMTKVDRESLRRQMAAAQAARDEERARVRAEAAARALRLWNGAKPASTAHPYLVAKGVHAFGLRLLRDQLMVPARDADGALHTLQFIGPDGTKRFLTGGRIAGCYYAIGRPKGALLLAEGYATAATLHQVTGHAVAVCFNCGNLAAVARALRVKFPRLQLLICADNDSGTPGNPGLKGAREAARASGAGVIWPQFERVRHG